MPNVSEHRKGDTAYFDDLEREMDGDGPACLLHYLLHYDIGDVNLRIVPKTRELAEQEAPESGCRAGVLAKRAAERLSG